MLDLGLQFEPPVPVASTVGNRADIACFIGFVPRSERYRDRLPDSLVQWLKVQGLIEVPGAPGEPEIRELEQLPVPIENWEAFVELFDWRRRPLGPAPEDGYGATYLGAAVRSFFAQGGRKCYVVRTGDPLPLLLDRELYPDPEMRRDQRRAQIGALLPAWSGNDEALSPTGRHQWEGIAHLFGLDDVSFVCLPDLPELVAQELPDPAWPPEEETPREYFVQCSAEVPDDEDTIVYPTGAPRCDMEAYRDDWAVAIRMAASFLGRHRKDVQLVAAVPLPAVGSAADGDLLDAFVSAGIMQRADSALGVSSAHVQLAYPWISWEGGVELPGGFEPPDGALTGLLARGTLLEGTFRSFADQLFHHVRRVDPELSIAQMHRLRPLTSAVEPDLRSLRQRVSLIGRTVDGIGLLSDVTTSADEAWRPASVNRLMSVWVRALRQAGETFAFEASGEATWASLQRRLELIGDSLYRDGALRGTGAAQAYQVRCGRSTMSQNDLDNGRLIAEVQFVPAVPIEGLRIALSLHESQQISVRQEVA